MGKEETALEALRKELEPLNALSVTLQQLEIRATESNLARLLGCLQTLSVIRQRMEVNLKKLEEEAERNERCAAALEREGTNKPAGAV